MAEEEKKIIRIEIDQSVIKSSKKAAIELGDAIAQIKAQQKLNRQETQEQKAAFVENEAKLKALNLQYRQHSEVLKQANIAEQAMIGSNEKLKAQLSILTSEYNKLSKEEKENTEQGQRLQKQIKGISDELKANEKAVGDNRRNVGNYSEAIEGALGNLGKFEGVARNLPGVLGGVAGGIVSMTRAAVAFIATPLGLIIAAIAAALSPLVAFLTKTQRGMDLVNQVSAALSATFSVLVDRLSGVGEAMVKAFENPQETVKELWETIKTNLLNRIQAIPALFTAIGKVIKEGLTLNFNEAKVAAKEAGEAFVQMGTGLDPAQQKKFADGIKGVVNEIKAEASTAAQLSKAMHELEDAEIAYHEEKSKLRTQIEKNRLASKEEGKSLKEREKLLREALLLEEEIGKKESEFAKERARISQAQIDLGESTREELKANAELQVRAIEIEGEVAKRKKEIQSELTGLTQKSIADQKKAADEQKKLDEEEAKRIESLREQFIKAEEEKAEIRNKFLAERITAHQTQSQREQAELKKRIQELRFAGVEENELTKFITEENTRIRVAAKEKQLAEAEALINAEAELGKKKIIIEIEDDKLRSAALFEIERARLEALTQLYNEQFQSATASAEGAVILDTQTKELLLEKETEFQAQLAELDRKTQEDIRSQEEQTQAVKDKNQKFGFDTAVKIADFAEGLAKDGTEEAKALSIASATIQAIQGIQAAYTSQIVPGDPTSLIRAPIAAGIAGAFGFANVAKIAATPIKAASGTFLKDGAGTETSDSIPAMLSKNETVINAKSSKRFLPLLSAINEWGGGVAFAAKGGSYDYLTQKFAGGGIPTQISNSAFENREITNGVANTINTIVPVLVLEEFQAKQGQQVRTATNLEI